MNANSSFCSVVMQWNCRSIITNLTYLEHHLSENKYKILVLQSLNVTESNLPKLKEYRFPPIYQKVKTKERVNTAIYIHETVNYTPCKSPMPNDIPSAHSCAAKIHFDSNTVFKVVSVYLPSGPNEQNTEWLRSLNPNDNWLICGDFNAHAPFWEKDCQIITSNRFIENIVDSSLYLLNDGSITRIPDISSHRCTAIDLSLISPILAPQINWETVPDSLVFYS